MKTKKIIPVSVLFILLITGCNQYSTKLSYVDVVKRMINLRRLAILPEKGETCAQWSSYDRESRYDSVNNQYLGWMANNDGSGFIREENGMIVMAEMKGPGAIVRIWSAMPGNGHVKIYIDNNEIPAIDLPFKDFFNDSTAPFKFPALAYEASKGKNLYIPITYQKSCKIMAEKNWGNYYHFNYITFPENTRIQPFSMNLGKDELAALQEVNDFFMSKLGTSPYHSDTSDQLISKSITLRPGESFKLADINGSFAIKSFKVNPHFVNRQDEFVGLRRLILQMKWDGEKQASVWSPLGDFFGTTPAINYYKSFPLGMTKDGFYCYWYMPFQKSALVELINNGYKTYNLSYEIIYERSKENLHNTGYFHAKWHSDVFPVKKEMEPDWTLLKTSGKGRFLGVMLHVMNLNTCMPFMGSEPCWWGEGDEKFFVDGEKFPSTYGTGSEDYFGYAWGNATLFQKAYHNQTMTTGNTTHQTLSRWHIMDNIPFQSSFNGFIEKYFSNECGVKYNCVVYWYLSGEGLDFHKEQPVTIDSVIMYPVIDPVRLIELPGKIIKVGIRCKEGKIHYTIDGSDPSSGSPVYKDSLSISKNTVLKACACIGNYCSSIVSGECVFIAPGAGLKNINGLKRGLKFKYYEHQWTKIPDFKNFVASDSGIIDKVTLGKQKVEDHFAFTFEGIIKVPSDGMYNFYLSSDDGSKLYINNICVVDNDNCHGETEVMGKYPMKAGYHPFRVEYFENELYQVLRFSYEGPGIRKQEVSSSVLFH